MFNFNTFSIVIFDSFSDVSYQTFDSSTCYQSFVQISIYVNLSQSIDFLVKNEFNMSFQDFILVESHEFIFLNVNDAEESFQSFIFEDINNIDVININNLFDI